MKITSTTLTYGKPRFVKNITASLTCAASRASISITSLLVYERSFTIRDAFRAYPCPIIQICTELFKGFRVAMTTSNAAGSITDSGLK